MNDDGRKQEAATLSVSVLIAAMAVLSFCISGCMPSVYVGTDVCLNCHNGTLATDKHEFLQSRHEPVGCESCHGPGALHTRVGGRYGLFINGANDVGALCVRCHQTETEEFNESAHARAGVLDCLGCHDPHASTTTIRSFTDNQLCLQCHAYREFETIEQITDHTWHSYDPQGSGASRCVLCHMPPTDRINQAGSRSHSLIPTPPIASNLAETIPAPPNSCAGVIGCHDGAVPTVPVFDVDDPQTNEWLQLLYDSRYGS